MAITIGTIWYDNKKPCKGDEGVAPPVLTGLIKGDEGVAPPVLTWPIKGDEGVAPPVLPGLIKGDEGVAPPGGLEKNAFVTRRL